MLASSSVEPLFGLAGPRPARELLDLLLEEVVDEPEGHPSEFTADLVADEGLVRRLVRV